MELTFLFLNLAKILFIPKSTEGGGSSGVGNIPKKKNYFGGASLIQTPLQIANWKNNVYANDGWAVLGCKYTRRRRTTTFP